MLKMSEKNYLPTKELKNLPVADLLEILFTQEDRVPQTVVDEFVRRSTEMIPLLWGIVSETNYWQINGPKWWAPVHATFILGAIGSEEVVIPLIMSLRFADAYDCDWVFEALPSIFGKIGHNALEPLKNVVLDQSNNWFVRAIAMDGMAEVTVNHPQTGLAVFDFMAQVLKSPYQDRMVRGCAGNTLLDFKQERYEKALLEFAREEEVIEDDSIFHFSQEDVLKELETAEPCLEHHARDWLSFYSKEEIEKRQQRWKRENSLREKLFGRILRWLRFRKMWKELDKKLKNSRDASSKG